MKEDKKDLNENCLSRWSKKKSKQKSENEISKIADASFGVKFMESNQETEDLMSEDSSNFQSFTRFELGGLLK